MLKTPAMFDSMQHKVVVITGGARRIGATLARTLGRAGARVVVNFRHSRDEATTLVDEIQRDGAEAIAAPGDMSKPHDVEALLQATLDRWQRVDALIANASTFHRVPLDALTAEHWHEAISNNLDAAALPGLAFGRWMKGHGGGAIVTLADTAGERPWIGYLPYSVAKAGVVSLTKGLAKELAPEVRVNAIAPGPMLFPADYDSATREREIQRTLLKRPGTPEHIAAAVLFLLGHDYITGAILPVDGGRGLT